jgi:hypothetical protein
MTADTDRDLFAAVALLGLVTCFRGSAGEAAPLAATLAEDAYKLADAMLAERRSLKPAAALASDLEQAVRALLADAAVASALARADRPELMRRLADALEPRGPAHHCPDCGGTGRRGADEQCAACRGEGEIPV